MHFAGLLGMPRRIYTYEAGRGLEMWNQLSTRRASSSRRGDPLLPRQRAPLAAPRAGAAGDDPWDAWTLEWSTTSPPPEYNFADAASRASRRPLWDLKHPDDPDWKYE